MAFISTPQTPAIYSDNGQVIITFRISPNKRYIIETLWKSFDLKREIVSV